MTVQANYNETMPPLCLGAISDTNEKTLISRNAEEVITFGKPVVQGAGDKGCRLAAAGDTAILGVSVMERSAINDQWEMYESVRIMTEGTIAVEALVAVAAGDPVHVDLAAAAFTNAGGVPLNHARFEDSAAAGELVRIRIAVA